MATRNLGSLTADLLLSLGGFKQGLDQAGREAEKAAQKIAASMKQGAQLTQSLLTPFEKYRAEIVKVDELLKKNAITQETYNRAVKAARDTYTSTSASAKAYNALLQEGKALQQSLRTPQEQLSASLARYNGLLKTGAINQETYNRAVARAQQTIKTSQGGFSSFVSSLGSINRLLLGFGVGFSAISVVNALKQATIAAIDFGEALEKAQAITGESVQNLQELEFVAKQSDVDFQGLVKSLNIMQRAIGEAFVSPTSEAAKALSDLGLSIEDLRKLGAAEQFELIADRINLFADETDRATLAQAIFKRSSQDVLPILALGSTAIRQLREEGAQFATVTEDQARALADLDNKLDRLRAAYDGLTRSTTATIAPALATFFERITALISGQEPPLVRLKDAWLDFFKVFGSPAQAASAIIRQFTGTPPPQLEPITITAQRIGDPGSLVRQNAKLREGIEDITDSLQKQILALQQQGLTADQAAMATARLSAEQKLAELGVKKLTPEIERQIAALGAATRNAAVRTLTRDLGDQARALSFQAEQMAKTGAAMDALAIASGAQLAPALTNVVSAFDEAAAAEARFTALAALAKDGVTQLTPALEKALDTLAQAAGQVSFQEADRRATEGLRDVERSILEATGRTADAAALEITARFEQLRIDLALIGDLEGLIKVDRLVDIEKARAQFEELESEINRIFSQQGRAEQAIQTKIQAGLLTEISAKKEVVALHQATAAQVDALIPKYEALALAIGDPAAIEAVKNLKAEVQSLASTVNDFAKTLADSFETNFADSLADVAEGISSLEDAFSDLLRNITRDILRFASQQIAGTLTTALAKAFGGIGGSTGGSFFGAIGKIFGFEKGGTIRRGTVGLVGERDPEVAYAGKSPLEIVRQTLGVPHETLDAIRPIKAAVVGKTGAELLAAKDSDIHVVPMRRFVQQAESLSKSIRRSLSDEVDIKKVAHESVVNNNRRSLDTYTAIGRSSIEDVRQRRRVFTESELSEWTREARHNIDSFLNEQSRIDSVKRLSSGLDTRRVVSSSLDTSRSLESQHRDVRESASSLQSARDVIRSVSDTFHRVTNRSLEETHSQHIYKNKDILNQTSHIESLREVFRTLTETVRGRSVFDLVGIIRDLRKVVSGRLPAPVAKFAEGGPMDIRSGGMLRGPGTPTSDSLLLWGSTKEFMVRAKAAQQPDAPAFLQAFNRGQIRMETIKAAFKALAVAPKLAVGGFTSPVSVPQMAWGGMTPALKEAGGGNQTIVNQYLTVSAPGGTVSRQTEMQITAAAARGVKTADRRNN